MRVWLARLWSRQVALLAEPKRVERVYMSTQGGGGGGVGQDHVCAIIADWH